MTKSTTVTDNAARGVSPILISMSQLCRLLSASESTINRWVRSLESFPQPVRLPTGTIRFRLAEVEAFIARLPRREYDDHGFDPDGR